MVEYTSPEKLKRLKLSSYKHKFITKIHQQRFSVKIFLFRQLKLENCLVNDLNILTRVKFNKDCHRHKLNLKVDDLKNFKSNEQQHEWNQLNIMFKL
jgi:hypothetical protein